jgi:hypothetical protein
LNEKIVNESDKYIREDKEKFDSLYLEIQVKEAEIKILRKNSSEEDEKSANELSKKLERTTEELVIAKARIEKLESERKELEVKLEITRNGNIYLIGEHNEAKHQSRRFCSVSGCDGKGNVNGGKTHRS